eukprot:COSAG06_NODE_4682_length_4037_cov_11.317166_3_plen_143_part_00
MESSDRKSSSCFLSAPCRPPLLRSAHGAGAVDRQQQQQRGGGGGGGSDNGADARRGGGGRGKETQSCAPFMVLLKIPSFYQDRLGTNTGTALKQKVMGFLTGLNRCERAFIPAGAKNAPLSPAVLCLNTIVLPRQARDKQTR